VIVSSDDLSYSCCFYLGRGRGRGLGLGLGRGIDHLDLDLGLAYDHTHDLDRDHDFVLDLVLDLDHFLKTMNRLMRQTLTLHSMHRRRRLQPLQHSRPSRYSSSMRPEPPWLLPLL